MNRALAMARPAVRQSVAPVIYDPARPILRDEASDRPGHVPAYNQRHRRSTILATIRRLLAQDGLDGVTVRRIAEHSGHAVQTIYNLVGPRDVAIVEAICEYSQYVNLTAAPDPFDPDTPAAMIDRELTSIRIQPDFCRNVCLIYFSGSRDIYYSFRDRQVKSMHRFLQLQQRAGILRRDVNALALSEQIMFLLGAICVEWADRDFPFEELRERICNSYENLMAGALVRPDFRLDRSTPIMVEQLSC